MNNHPRPPPVGSKSLTQLIYETLHGTKGLSIQELASRLQIRQYHLLHHMWLLKLTGSAPDIIANVSNVCYDSIPSGLRDAVARSFPETKDLGVVEDPVATPVLPPPSRPAVSPQPLADTPVLPPPSQTAAKTQFTTIKKTPHMKKYGRLADRVEEFVNYVRTNPPKTISQLSRAFGVESTCIRRYLYAMYLKRVNLDVPRKVLWKNAGSDTVQPYMLAQLNRHPVVGLVEFPLPVCPAAKPAEKTPEKPATITKVSAVSEIEKLALKALKEGNTAVASALGQALVLVEKNTISE